MNDTIVIYRQPERAWPDGMRSREDFVAVVLHRQPLHPRPYPVEGSDRTVYVGNRTREHAIQAFDDHDRCPFKHVDTNQRCTLPAEHPGMHQV